MDRGPAGPGYVAGSPSRSCLARAMPSTTGSTASRCEGFDDERDRQLGAVAADQLARRALVVLHVARALHASRGRGCPRTRRRSRRRTCRRCWRGRSAGHGAPCRGPPRRRPARPPRPRRRRGTGSSTRRLRGRTASGRRSGCARSARRPRPRSGARGCAAARSGGAASSAPLRRAAGSSASRPALGCACTRCRWSGSRRRAASRGSRPRRQLVASSPRPSVDEAPVEVPDREAVGERVELGVQLGAASCPSGSSCAMRWPRTRYMLMSCCTVTPA